MKKVEVNQEISEVKKLVKSLRQALKATGVEISHNQALKAYAVAKGFKNWEAFEASSTKAEVKSEPKGWKLDNSTGLYDFPAPKGQARVALSGQSFSKVVARLEKVSVQSILQPESFYRGKSGELDSDASGEWELHFEAAGESEVDWDSQQVELIDGQVFYLLENGKSVPARYLVLAPADQVSDFSEKHNPQELGSQYSNLELRPFLMAEVWTYLYETKQDLKFIESKDLSYKMSLIQEAEQALGFSLIHVEKQSMLQGTVYSSNFIENHFGLIENEFNPDEKAHFNAHNEEEFKFLMSIDDEGSNRILTFVEGDFSYALAVGFHRVNRLYHLVTEKSMPEGLQEVIDPQDVSFEFDEDSDDYEGIEEA